MCKVISAISYKGGVGKTTSAVNISSYLQMQGKRVCTVDLDPQHNLSRHFGILPGHLKNRPTIYDVINAAIQEQEDRKIEQLIKDCICHSTTVDSFYCKAFLAGEGYPVHYQLRALIGLYFIIY